MPLLARIISELPLRVWIQGGFTLKLIYQMMLMMVLAFLLLLLLWIFELACMYVN